MGGDGVRHAGASFGGGGRAQPFDLRPRGYSVGEARALLTMLGDAGRAYYADVQLALDTIYPATYALSRALAIWWLTMPGRLRAAPLRPRSAGY